MELVADLLAGEERSLARLITLVEREDQSVPEIMRLIHSRTGRAFTVGVTGPPGAGKSTLVDRLTAVLRQKGFSVGIIAVDPTSPFSGGALLGDRIRMQQHYLDKGVFIRSMATRGSRGSLPRTARSVIRLLDAFGKDFILVETIGVGQNELDIMETVDTVVVTLVPEAGDAIQAMKAGLMEIADIFVVNKADREGAMELATEIRSMLHLNSKASYWEVPVLLTQALYDQGIEELYQQIAKHEQALESSGKFQERRREQQIREFWEAVEEEMRKRVLKRIERDEELSPLLEQVERGELEPRTAAMEVLSRLRSLA